MATQATTSMISEVAICNTALAWLGQTPITTLDDPADPNAEKCRNVYPFVRDAVLEEREWTFARARATSTTEQRDDWDQWYKHSFPEDWLTVSNVYEDANSEENIEWVREGRYILTKYETVYMRGLKRIVDTGQFSNLFVQALAARMAADLAVPLTQDRQMQADMWQLYQAKLMEAAARDGYQGSSQKLKTGNFINGRYTGGYIA